MNINKLTWIGITVFFAVFSFFYGVRFLQDEAFQKSIFKFNVVFNDLQGLDISDDVKMLGKRIGRVSGTRIIGQNIAAELTIDNNFAFKLPIDSDIEITQSDLLGGKFISIYPGKDNDKFILEGETIAGKNGEVVSITKDVGDLAKRLSETFGVQQREQIKNTLTNIESTASQLQEFMNANKNLISENDKDNLHQLLSNINTITFNLNNLINDESSNIKNSIQSFNNFMETVPGISNSIDAMLVDVGAVVKNINSGDGSLSKIINQNELYDNVNGLVLDARSLLDDVKNNPAKYLRAWFEAKKK
jgi:phospholipid/cholesterol/gamma-HCH transport system substrate-binding protein